jgi:purine-binding chemotaxis protein CheW
MTGDILIARVAGERFALPATQIQSVIELEQVVSVPRAPDFVTGLATLRSRTLTVIDVARVLGLDRPVGQSRFALVVDRDGCGYALAVDAVEHVVAADGPVEPMRMRLSEGWMRCALGVVPCALGTVLALDLDLLVAGPQLGIAA